MIRVFVGTSAKNEDLEAQMVLEATIRRYASEPVEIEWMRQQSTGPWSGWLTRSWRTPFTGFRWGVPDACGYQGRAIYVDVDFFFRADIAELWRQPVPGAIALHGTVGKLRTSCLLFDCAAAKGVIPPISTLRRLEDANASVTGILKARTDLLNAYEGDWNCLDGRGYDDITDPRIKAIHYSRIETQLHLRRASARLAEAGKRHWYTGPTFPHPRPDLVALFEAEYRAALDAGYHPRRYEVEPFESATRRAFVYKAHRGGRTS